MTYSEHELEFTFAKNERSVAFRKRQNPFLAVAPPRTPLGELTTLPRPPSRLKRGHPSAYPTTLGTNPPLALAMRPPGIPARSTPMPLMHHIFDRPLVRVRIGQSMFISNNVRERESRIRHGCRISACLLQSPQDSSL